MRTTLSRQRRKQRSAKTLEGYENTLDFFVAHAALPRRDPRLATLGLDAGAVLRCDDPESGINERDLITLIDLRAHTDLRLRAAERTRATKWHDAVAKEVRTLPRRPRAGAAFAARAPRGTASASHDRSVRVTGQGGAELRVQPH